jgi:single-strand DNA-binding protein
MSIDMNLVVMGGRLTDDPSSIGDGNSGCKFDIASNRSYRDKSGERREDPTYMPVVCWSTLSEIVMKRGRKGSAVLVEGRLSVRKFTGDDGKPRKYVSIVARDVRFVDSKPRDTEREETAKEAKPSAQHPFDLNDKEHMSMLAKLLNANAAS